MKQLSSADIAYRSIVAGDRAFNFEAALDEYPNLGQLEQLVGMWEAQRGNIRLKIETIFADWDGVLGGGGEEMSSWVKPSVDSQRRFGLEPWVATADLSQQRQAQAEDAGLRLIQIKKPDDIAQILEISGADPATSIMIGDHAAKDKVLLDSEHTYDSDLLARAHYAIDNTIKTSATPNREDSHRDRDKELFMGTILIRHHSNSPMPEDVWRETIRTRNAIESLMLFNHVIQRNPGIIQSSHLS